MVTRKISFFDMHKIADSGQAFRIREIDKTHTELIAFGRYLQVADLEDGSFAFSCSEKEFKDIWERYFDLDRDYNAVAASIDPDDNYLKDAAAFSSGIRILKQDIFETVISYIISQRRSIPSITTSVERISALCGKSIPAPKLKAPFVKPLEEEYHAFPSPSELASLSLEKIEGTGVGYRAPYIIQAATGFDGGMLDPDSLTMLDDEALYRALTAMFGVGTKVANCVMLFAFARTSRFPIDVWIQRIVDRYYGGSFDCSKYPETAGIMQQFMFYYERRRDNL
jgi:N-glycosylase/DNA lyase